jgi:hypothetical protein
MELRPDVDLRWMRSHCGQEEAHLLGISEVWRVGNDKADSLAKQAAGWVDLPEGLMQQHRRHCDPAERIAGTVAAIQLRRLQARSRTEAGGAVKERVRVLPGLPRRLRAQGVKRARQQPEVGHNAGQAAGPLVAGHFLQMKPAERPGPALIREVVQCGEPPVAGVHRLVVQGPWPIPGSGVAVNGRLAGLWSCTTCGKRAADSSRAVQLARSPCQAAGWRAEPAAHDLQEYEGGVRCSRCWLRTSARHEGQASRSQCPVPRVIAGELPWPEGEAGIRDQLGRIRGYRRWCEHQGPAGSGACAAPDADADAGAGLLGTLPGMASCGSGLMQVPPGGAVFATVAVHELCAELPVKRARLEVDRAAPLLLVDGPEERRRLKLARQADPSSSSSAAAASGSVTASSAGSGCRRGELQGDAFVQGRLTGAARLNARAALAAVAARTPPASGAHAAEPTAASSHCGRNRTLPIDVADVCPLDGPKCPLGGPKCPLGGREREGGQPVLGASGAVRVATGGLSRGVALGAVVSCEPRASVCGPYSAKARAVVEVETQAPALSAVVFHCGHLAIKLGRSGLWCLRCFCKPIGHYQAWLRECCAREQPPHAMPRALTAALLRARPIDGDASEGLRTRHALLVAAARVVPALPAARPQEAGGMQVEEH